MAGPLLLLSRVAISGSSLLWKILLGIVFLRNLGVENCGQVRDVLNALTCHLEVTGLGLLPLRDILLHLLLVIALFLLLGNVLYEL